MENQIYQLQEKDIKLDFFCCQTNDLNPTREIRELGIVVFDNKGLQIDYSFDEHEFDSLIEYLTRLNKYCKEFNSESVPTTK